MRHFLIFTVLTILAAAGLLFLAIAYNFLPHYFHIPLHAYVSLEVEPAAIKFEAADYPAALQIFNSKQPLSPIAAMELHYIRALCLQATSQFAQSRREYSYVEHHSTDDDLKVRAAVGEIFATLHVAGIMDLQTRFPDYAPAVDSH